MYTSDFFFVGLIIVSKEKLGFRYDTMSMVLPNPCLGSICSNTNELYEHVCELLRSYSRGDRYALSVQGTQQRVFTVAALHRSNNTHIRDEYILKCARMGLDAIRYYVYGIVASDMEHFADAVAAYQHVICF